MDKRPHSNSVFKSKLVTNGERHRRRSMLIIGRRAERHTGQLISFSEVMVRIFAVSAVIAFFLFLGTR